MPKLIEILKGIEFELLRGNLDVEIRNISYDSRSIKDGDLFFCLPGQHTHGKKFVYDAIKNGARAIVVDENLELDGDVNIIKVRDIRKSFGKMASNFFGEPSLKFKTVGVTGTNGKTTVTHMLEKIFSKAGFKTGLIGTIKYKIADEEIPASLTTPQASDLQAMLNEMVKRKVDVCIMEISSHALALDRVEGMKLDVACFTNLTAEHLDFHADMEDYFLAKSKIFGLLKDNGYAVINVDDKYGERLWNSLKVRKISCSIINKADFFSSNIELSKDTTRFTIYTKSGTSVDVEFSLIGRHNVYNALIACAAANVLGVEISATKEALCEMQPVSGRLEKVNIGQNFDVIIDYAHTEDALRNAILSLKPYVKNRLIVVFGCGGERDRSKRPKMGEVAASLSDIVVITSDNPRGEDPQKIILDIEVGIRKIGKNNYTIIENREEAIKHAINIAQDGDVVLIAGKGHETYQIIGKNRIPFNDKEVAAKYISRKIGKIIC